MIRGRFAPSPTGDLHLGNARTALLAWLQVRAARGRFILRVEDLDVGRVRDEYRVTQLTDLRWLGLDWDEGPEVGGPFGPYLQSGRTAAHYEPVIERLAGSGLIYPCVCSRKEIAAAASAPHPSDDEGPVYPGTCRTWVSEAQGLPSALRFRVPPGPVCFHDELYGERCYEPAREVGDFVVRRKDGVAAYQLAVVVDDAAMAITDVVRGADLLASTARQILLYRALGLEPPRWTHVPLLLEPNGARAAKRVGSLTLRTLRQAGVSPERVVGWLASSCGLTRPGDELTPYELIDRYEPDRVPREDTALEFPRWMDSN